MSQELEALEQAAANIYRGIARLRVQQGVERDVKMKRLTERVDDIEDKIAALGAEANVYATSPSTDEVIEAAINARRTITFKYTGLNGDVTLSRTISPYEYQDAGLVLGYDHMRDGIRRFDTERMEVQSLGRDEYVDPA